MRAQTPKQYKEAWTWHIEQLATLALAAKIEYNEYVEMKEDLLTWLDKAIEMQLWEQRK